jgi:hypothetical protein
MSGDYTRMRYTPRSGYIGVLEQQGRVRLDADGNELVEAIDRRRRAECIDTIGFAVFPTDPNPANGQPTINGFLITTGAGKYFIGQGRGYVDGIQVDCWGADPQQFQPNLGESVGTNPLPYDSQPFFYSPNFLEISAVGNSIVYLDVWEREVTALEDPGLIDPALEGIDTTTRIQAAWQVKAISTSASTCSDVPPEWTALIAPSTGVLTSGTLPAPSGDSPCVIDPQSGYTGLENRLFRVQIYKSGAVDASSGSAAATFVWSEDNASLGAAITAITSAAGVFTISVTTVGRDTSFRFQVGDVLEVLSDYTEWSIRETNVGGQIVTVTQVDPQQLTLTVNTDLSAWFAGLPPGVNPRLRKWDAAPQPTNNGSAISIGTEGVTVTFGATPAATLKAGDYWLFYARTNTGKVEPLNQAPPRGLHHYAKLAVVNPTANPPIQDCRVLWPPPMEGCCTVVVNVGDDVQKAIDSVDSKIGGCVCLKAGLHILTKPLVIDNKQDLMFHGESIGAVLQGPPQQQVLSIAESSNITVESITFQGAATVLGAPLVQLRSVIRCAFRHCIVSADSSGKNTAFGRFGFLIVEAEGLEISDCVISSVLEGIIASGSDLSLLGNQLLGPQAENYSAGVIGIEVQLSSGPVEISGNTLADFGCGIILRGSDTRPNPLIIGNSISRGALSPNSSSPFTFSGALGQIIQTKIFAIASDIRCQIADNLIASADPGHGGILAFGPHQVLERNRIISTVTPQDNTWSSLPVGIVVYQPEGGTAEHARVVGNTLQGPQNGIAAIAESADSIGFTEILDNFLDPTSATGASLVQQSYVVGLTNPGIAIPQIGQSLSQLNTAPATAAAPAPFGILLINPYSANVVRNIMSGFTVGIAAVGFVGFAAGQFSFESQNPSASLDGNESDACAVGVFLDNVGYSSIQNGTLQDNTFSFALYETWNLLVEGNTSIESATNKILVHVYELFGYSNRFQHNNIESGATGFLSVASSGITIAENEIEFTAATGVLIYTGQTEANVFGNRLLGCGATAVSAVEANIVGTITVTTKGVVQTVKWNFGTTVSAAIALVSCSGTQSVEGCHVLNTAEVQGGQCADILILDGSNARVRDCRITRQSAGIAAEDFGCYVYPAADWFESNNCGADVSGNSLNLNGPSGKVLLAVDVENALSTAPLDILFNGNLVLQTGAGALFGSVKLTADSLAITGNRIRFSGQKDYSLTIQYTTALSYVGNVVSRGQQINSIFSTSGAGAVPLVLPAPVPSFNVNK